MANRLNMFCPLIFSELFKRFCQERLMHTARSFSMDTGIFFIPNNTSEMAE